MAALQDTGALLVFRVGPVQCCAPTAPVENIIVPPRLTRVPGSGPGKPGIFRHAGHVVRVVDLRERFGIEAGERDPTGRLVIVHLRDGRVGYWVDAIGDVVPMPTQGWSALPPQIPREIFSRALIFRERLTLYTDFERVKDLHEDHLRAHIAGLKQERGQAAAARGAPPGSLARAVPAQAPPRADTQQEAAADSRTPAPPQPPSQPTPEHRPPPERPIRPLPVAAAGDRQFRTPTNSPAGRTWRTPTDTAAPGPESARDGSSRADSGTGHPAQPPLPRSRGASQPPPHATADSPIPIPAPVRPPASPPHPAGREAVPAPHRLNPEPVHAAPVRWPLVAAVLLLTGLAAWMVAVTRENDAPRAVRLSPPSAKQPPPAMREEATLVPPPATPSPSPAPEVATAPQPVLPPPPAEMPQVPQPATTVEVDPTRSVGSFAPPTATPEPEIVAKLPPPAAAATVTIRRDREGLVIEIEDRVSPRAETTEESVHDAAGVEPRPPHPGAQPEATSESADSTTEQAALRPEPAPAKPSLERPPGAAGSERPTLAVAESPKPRRRVMVVHTVVKGDTLWHIAIRHLGDPFRYPELARLSRIRNPDLIYPGDKVKIIRTME